jgi:hypothetical protein
VREKKKKFYPQIQGVTGTQMCLPPFPLLACLLALIAITFSFFFFLINYGVAAFLSTLLM